MSSDNSSIIKLVIFLIIAGIITGYYLSRPSAEKPQRPTFEESLEKRKLFIQEEDNVSIRKSENLNYQNNNGISYKEQQDNLQINHSKPNIENTQYDYNILLDSLVVYPSTSVQALQLIVNKLLIFKGYPAGTVRVVEKQSNNSQLKTHENYEVANFDFSSGTININPKMLYELKNKVLIAILAHELDHFDKLANTCKYLGINQFNRLFAENNISINTGFWEDASKYANGKEFSSRLYEESLKRFLSQNQIERTSSYSDFYKLSENMRNPLEVSAYKESDYVFQHYKIKQEDGPIKRLTQKFNDVDWAIFNFIDKNPDLKNERIAVFDYYFAQAIMDRMPQFTSEYKNCVENKNGDLTDFWLAYENSVKSFYKRGSTMDKQTYDKIYGIMDEMNTQVKTPLTSKEIAQAMKFKANTLTSNLVYPNATKNLSQTIKDYLVFIKKEGITDNEQELKSIITLICMENDLTTNKKDNEISLYDLKFPEEISSLYNIEDKKGRFMFIYNNPAFINKKPIGMSEQDYLVELLNKNRIDIRIK